MLKPYGEYKKAGIPWLEEVPGHWRLERIGALFVERREKVSDTEYAPLSVTKKGIVPQLENAAKSNDGDNRKLVCTGDFVINSRSDRKGSSGVSSLTGSVSLINVVLKPREENSEQYIHYLLKSNDFVEEYYRNGRGIVADLWTTRYSEMKTILLPIPPRPEQDQIVRYLDWQISKINKLVTAKKKQIELLKEQKQAVINKAVTKGLDDTVPMKDSGIEWLGEVPEHWQINRLKHFCKVNASITHFSKIYNDNDELVFLPMENISSDGVIDCSQKRKYKDVKSGYSSFAKNDVVVAKITPCFENGKGACLDKLETEIGYGTTELITIRANEKILPQCLYFVTKTQFFRLMGEEQMTGSAGQKRISSNFIETFVQGIPPLKEQELIVAYISNMTGKVDTIIKETEQEIELISEYKTSLISSVVTGKVDVRDVLVPEFESIECEEA